MDRQPVQSSNVTSVGYDAESLVLEVEFRSGGVYLYAGVQPEVYADLLRAPSVGRYIQGVIKPAYPVTKVEDPT